jgi:hypothetical protein
MMKKLAIFLSLLLSTHLIAIEPLHTKSEVKPPAKEEPLTDDEKKEIVDEQQELFGKGSAPILPKEDSTLRRNLLMVLVTLVTAVAGIAAVGNNPGHSAP